MSVQFIISDQSAEAYKRLTKSRSERAISYPALNAHGKPTGLYIVCGHSNPDGSMNRWLIEEIRCYETRGIPYRVVTCYPRAVKARYSRKSGHVTKNIIGDWICGTRSRLQARDDRTATFQILSEAEAGRLGLL